jgi:CspA family cold shock protein
MYVCALLITYFIIMEGTVKFFNESKGFGFITNDETGKDIFVHITGLSGESLNEGDKVEYVEEEGRKGLTAAQVRVINE